MVKGGLLGAGLGIVLMAGGCHETLDRQGPRPEPAPPPPPSECDASGASWAEGEHATDQVVERARLASGAQSVRVIGPGQDYTMEFDPDRLNLEVDESDRILEVRCG